MQFGLRHYQVQISALSLAMAVASVSAFAKGMGVMKGNEALDMPPPAWVPAVLHKSVQLTSNNMV